MNPPPLSSPQQPFGSPDQVRRDNKISVKKGILLGCGGCAGLLLISLLIGGAIFYFVVASVRSTEPFQQTLQAAQASPELRQSLGEPITLGWWFSGSVNWENGYGTADVQIPLKGPKGGTTVLTIGSKNPSGPWNFTKMETTTTPPVNLLP